MTFYYLDGLEEALGLILPGPDERRDALRLGVVCAWLVRCGDVLLRGAAGRCGRGPHVVVRGRGGGGGGGCAGDGLPQELAYRRTSFKEAASEKNSLGK